MSRWIAGFFVLAVASRLASLLVSRRHERALRSRGAEEHGAAVSRTLALAHAGFYGMAFLEALLRGAQPGPVTVVGAAVWGAAMLALVLVVRELGPLWTVKVYLAPDHTLERGPLLRAVRHPNYYLNVLPELVGLALVLRGWWTLALGLPLYLVVLRLRIVGEERVMRRRFADY